MKASFPLLGLSLGLFGVAASMRPAPKPAPKVNFDRDVMPIISQHCFKCHGPDAEKAAAGLRLDKFDGATKNLGDGAAIVPGNPSKSLLFGRVEAKDKDMRMPPADSGVAALTADQIATLKAWVLQGAKYEKHWSYVPPTLPAIPKVSDPAWCKNLVDRFVMAKLDEAGLKPEAEADRDTLALRAAETLTGLPPSPADLSAFRADKKPGAYERYVDRLLAEPTYGEHEGRYWLDAVRYADTHGLQLDNERGFFPYRDWVVRAFNEDLPYNKFTLWQLAGDMLPNPTTEQLIATGYIRANLTSNEGGAIEAEFLARNTFDRVDTTSTVFLGLTYGCAKCHDHKYDPIKQKDYYGMYAFFDSTKDAPLDGNALLPPPVISAPSPDQAKQLASMDNSLGQCLASVNVDQAVAYMQSKAPVFPVGRDWQISPIYSSPTFDEAFDKPEPGEPGQPDAAWKPMKFEFGTPAANIIRKDNSAVYVRGTVHSDADRTLTLRVSSDDGIRLWLNGTLIHSHKIGRGLDESIDIVRANFRAGDNVLVAKLINGVSGDGLNIRLGTEAEGKLSYALAAYEKSPTNPAATAMLRETYLTVGPTSDASKRYEAAVKGKTALEAMIPKTLIAQEMPMPRPTFILKRGQYDQIGDPVTRHLPAFLGSLPAGSKPDRLSLAEWMISPQNPLVARVFVNRLWQQHFGTGIVKTSEDFGSQGEWPENRALLDYLAVSFVKNGWSIKKLNRLIVTSAAFRQSSRITAAKLASDPENRLISRGPRFRLDAEVIRDKALADGGLLVEELGGRGFKPYQPAGLWEGASDPESGTHIYKRDHDKSIYRRSLYMFWKRTAPPPVLTTFDAPLRDTCTVRRAITDTPLQALTVMNETAFVEASRTMAARVLGAPGDDATHMRKAFEIALGRPPLPEELNVMKKVLAEYRKRYAHDVSDAEKLLNVGDAPQSKTIAPTEQAVWMIVCSSLMNTDEFLTLH
jgi:hypothetical protein